MGKRKVVAEAFTNDLGQVIQPGDEIIFVGESYKSTSVRRALFEGIYKEMKSRYGPYNRETRRQEYLGKEEVIVAVGVSYEVTYNDWKYVDGRYTKLGEKTKRQFSRLPLKRVYKIDMSLAEFADKARI